MKEKYTLIDTWVQEAKNSNQAAKEQLINTFKPLILSVMQKYIYDTEAYEDALQDGALVVLEAVQAYDPDLGVVFPFYLKNQPPVPSFRQCGQSRQKTTGKRARRHRRWGGWGK